MIVKRIIFIVSFLVLAGCGSRGGHSSPPVPAVALSTNTLAFVSPACGSNPASQNVEITNAGEGGLTWSVSNLPAWLLITPESGTAPSTVTAQVHAADLLCGQSYSAVVQVGVSGRADLSVSLTVTLILPESQTVAPPPPAIGINPNSLEINFTAPACGGVAVSSSPSFEIVNTGSGTFNWTGAAGPSWIQFTPSSGSAGASVTVQDIDTSNLPCGVVSSGVISISSSEAGNSPVSVTVKVTVPSAANITPSLSALPFFATTCKASPAAQQFTIQNTGGTLLGWTAAVTYSGSATGWATLGTLNGTIPAGGNSGNISVTVDASGLACAQGYSATITLTATSGGNAVSLVQPRIIPLGLSNPAAWSHQSPMPTGDHLRKVSFSEPGVAWAVGDGGTLLRSNDHGNSWTHVASGTAVNLNAIAFASPVEGWIAGVSGMVRHTTDGGATWATESSGVNSDLLSLSVVDISNVWGVGKNRTIIYRDSTGQWTSRPTASLDSQTELNSIVMNDAVHGWIAAKKVPFPPVNYLFWTDDNWATIQQQTIPSNPTTAAEIGPLSSLFFLPNSGNGWAVGDVDTDGNGTILQIQSSALSSPGSITWQTSGVTGNLGDVYFSDPSNGWAVGDDGTIIQTSNGGTSWSTQTTGPSSQLLRSLAFSGGSGITVGFSGSVVTTSDGSTWSMNSTGSINQLNAVSFADALNGWAVGLNSTVLATSDGGTTWASAPGTHGGTLNGVHAVTATNVWAVASNRNVYRFNGTSWSLQTTGITGGIGQTLNGVFFLNTNNGWVAGKVPTATENQIYYYNGSSWASKPIPCASTSTTMNAVQFISTTRGWVAGTISGVDGIVAQTSDNGANWDCSVANFSGVPLRSVYFIDTLTGWAVGNSGKIFKTADGGGIWVPQTSNTTDPLNKVYFTDATHGWIAGGTGGAGGFVLATTDGGVNWTRQEIATTQALTGIYLQDASNGWAVGNNGTIVHTTSGGNN